MTPKSTTGEDAGRTEHAERGGARSGRRTVVSSLTVEQAAGSWYRALEARMRSPHTVLSYRQTLHALVVYLTGRDASTSLADITRQQIEEFLVVQRSRFLASTVYTRFIALRAFFNWCVAEEELTVSPMARLGMAAPEAPSPAVLTRAEVEALLKTCAGKSFADRRDRAIFVLLIDTGMRLQDITQLTLDTIDQDAQTLSIVSKGRRARKPHYDKAAAAALDAYLRARLRRVNGHPHYADERALWLGLRGPLSSDGIYQMVRRRARQAGLGNVHPHLFRHGFADAWLDAGGTEGDLARLAGWVPGSKMLHRYGAAQAEKRAQEAHKRLSPANQLMRPESPKR